MAIDSLFFSFQDIKEELKRKKKRWIQVTACAFFFSLFLFFLTPVTFTAEATFKEEVEKEGQISSIKDILGAVSTFEPKAAVLMRSKTILKPVIGSLGLQASVKDRSTLGIMWDEWYDNFRLLLKKPIQDRDSFLFKDISYEGEKGVSLKLKILSKEKYAVFANRKKIGEGELFEPFHYDECTFTIYHFPENVKIGKSYPLTISPWLNVFNDLYGQLKIKADKVNNSILKITLLHRDRWLAVTIVNEVMNSFKRYLYREQNEKARAQIAYLERRQNDLYTQWEKNLKRHVAHVKKNIDDEGFYGYQDRLAHFLRPMNAYSDKLLALELEDRHLQKGECAKESPIYLDLKKVSQQKEELGFKKNLIHSALLSRSQKKEVMQGLLQNLERLEQEEDSLTKEMLSLSREKEELLTRKAEIKELAEPLSFPNDPSKFFKQLSKEKERVKQTKDALRKDETVEVPLSEQFPFSKQEILSHLQEIEKLLELKEQVYKERLLSSIEVPSDLDGIELETANSLVAGYQSQLDQSAVLKEKLHLMHKQLDHPYFDAGSMIESVRDPISQKLVAKISDLQQSMQDKKNRSEKERGRISAEITLCKEFLQNHVEQLSQIEELNQNFIQQNMKRMQGVIIDRINQRIAALDQQEDRFIDSRKKQIAIEKNLLSQKINELKQEVHSLPNQWFEETLLKWQTELSMRMMESITKILESKTISTHLHNIASKPLDYAVQPLSPNRKKLFLKTIFFTILFSISFLLYLIINMYAKGFVPSLSTLQALGQRVLGEISSYLRFSTFNREEMETLRSAISFLREDKAKKIALFSSDRANVSFSLAELLSKIGYRPLVCSLSFTKGDGKVGLLEYLQGQVKDLPKQEKEGYDFIPSGGVTPFGYELISSSSFSTFVKEIENEYDFLIFHHDGTITSEEAKNLLQLVEKAIVCYEKEKIEALQPYMDWGYIDIKSVAFIKVAH